MTNARVLATDAIQEVPEAPAPAISHKHVKSLDGVRGLAILVVLVHHLTSSCWPSAHPSVHHLRDILYMGWAGVDLFFVLSGFLITGILMDTKSADNYFQAFYMRRVLRIFPVVFLVFTALTLAYYAPFGWHMVPSSRPLNSSRSTSFISTIGSRFTEASRTSSGISGPWPSRNTSIYSGLYAFGCCRARRSSL